MKRAGVSPCVRFGDLVRQDKRSVDVEAGGVERYIAGEHMDTDDLHIRTFGTVGDGYLGPAFHRAFRAGQVLYGSRRTYLRKVAVPGFDGVCANTTFVCEPADERLTRAYLPWVMRTSAFHKHSISRSKGSVNPYVNWKDIAAFEFPLPLVAEQQRIARVLWASDDACEMHRDALLLASTARRALLNSHISGASETVQLADVAKFVNGTTFPKRYQGGRSGDYPHFKVSDMNGPGNERELRVAENWITSEQAAEMGARIIPPGAVVFARVGAALAAERRRLLPQPSVIDDNMMAAVPSEGLLPEYLHACMTAIRLATRRNDGVVPSINQTIVGAVRLPVPARQEQNDVVDGIGRLDDLVDALRVRLSDCRSLTQRLTDELVGYDVH